MTIPKAKLFLSASWSKPGHRSNGMHQSGCFVFCGMGDCRVQYHRSPCISLQFSETENTSGRFFRETCCQWVKASESKPELQTKTLEKHAE